MNRRVLVTGGAGFIGSHVADAFLAAGWDVTVMDNLARGKAERTQERYCTPHRRKGRRAAQHRAILLGMEAGKQGGAVDRAGRVRALGNI